MIYLLDFRDRPEGGAVTTGRLDVLPNGPSEAAAADLLRTEDRVLFLIHGFNVNRAEGTARLGNLAQFLPKVDGGAVVSVLWPGDHWVGAISYPFEGRDADETADALAKFIGMNVRVGVKVSFITHSLGARVAMETAKRLEGGANAVEQICLMAPAIDDFSLAADEFYLRPASASVRVAVLSSVNDMVLRLAYPAGDLLQAFVFWDDIAGSALGYRGPVAHEASGTDVPKQVFARRIPEGRNAGHGDYLPDFGPGLPPGSSQSAQNQLSAAMFANDVILGVPVPQYR